MNSRPRSLSTSQLVDALRHPDVRLIDVRPVEAYNGWRMRNEARGGHIAGARSLPHKWIRYLDWPDIVQAKGLSPAHRLVVYGYDQAEADEVARHFAGVGYRNVAVYDEFLTTWSPDSSLPLDRLPRYRRLVSAQWLDGLLRTGTAPEYDNRNCVLCHTYYRNRAAYDQGHIPGAVPIDTNTLESPQTWNRRPPHELRLALETAGITHKTTVILYGSFSSPDTHDPFPGSSAGQLAAMRCALIMLYAGVEDVRVLNAVLLSWLDAGLPTSTAETPHTPVSDFGLRIPQRPELIVDLPEAREILRQPDQNLVCVRSWPEFIGEVSGYNYISKKGRIPGAVFGNCGSDAYHMENYRNLDHTTREYHEVEALWATAGITPDKYNAFYCGTGWRASEAFFNAWLMGWPRIAVYDGGWFEWSSDDRNPCVTGVPAGHGLTGSRRPAAACDLRAAC
jgi:3-mercaptopyruvate sulfurtransferase SseA